MFPKKKINKVDLFIIIMPIILIILVIIKVLSDDSNVDTVVNIEVSTYTIEYGDTLSEIAERVAISDNVPYKRAFNQLKALNPYSEFGIRAGDTLMIPKFIKKEVNNNG